jgi:hypothetical protein
VNVALEKPSRLFGVLILVLATVAGCAKTPTAPKAENTPIDEAKIQAALAKLSDADRPLAEAQKYCPVEKTRLGSMGKPARIDIDGQAVFLCCSGCAAEARADAKKTLGQVAQFRKEK